MSIDNSKTGVDAIYCFKFLSLSLTDERFLGKYCCELAGARCAQRRVVADGLALERRAAACLVFGRVLAVEAIHAVARRVRSTGLVPGAAQRLSRSLEHVHGRQDSVRGVLGQWLRLHVQPSRGRFALVVVTCADVCAVVARLYAFPVVRGASATLRAAKVLAHSTENRVCFLRL